MESSRLAAETDLVITQRLFRAGRDPLEPPPRESSLPASTPRRSKARKVIHRALQGFLWLALAGVLSACCLHPEGPVEGNLAGQERPLPRPTGHGEATYPSLPYGAELQSMSTSDLVEVVISDPKMIEIFAYSSFQQGFDAVRVRYEPLSELLARQDAGSALLARYQTLSSEPTPGWSSREVGQWLFQFQRLELILAQDEVLAQLDPGQRCDLLRWAQQKLEGKRQVQDLHGKEGEISTVRLMGRILQFSHWGELDRLAGNNDELRLLLDEGGFDFPGVVDQIVTQAEMVLSGTCAAQ